MWVFSEIMQFFNMLLKIWWLVKWQVTFVTLEGLLFRVYPFVLLEMRRLSETFFTNWALMGLWLCMDSFMQFKTPCCSKSLVALFTFKGLQIIMFHVTIKIWFLMKALFTLWTPVWFHTAVVFNMSLKISWLVKIFPTLGTGKALLIMGTHVLKGLLIWKEQNCCLKSQISKILQSQAKPWESHWKCELCNCIAHMLYPGCQTTLFFFREDQRSSADRVHIHKEFNNDWNPVYFRLKPPLLVLRYLPQKSYTFLPEIETETFCIWPMWSLSHYLELPPSHL